MERKKNRFETKKNNSFVGNRKSTEVKNFKFYKNYEIIAFFPKVRKIEKFSHFNFIS